MSAFKKRDSLLVPAWSTQQSAVAVYGHPQRRRGDLAVYFGVIVCSRIWNVFVQERHSVHIAPALKVLSSQ